MKFKNLKNNLINFCKNSLNKFLRDIDDKKRTEIAKSYESTVKFLMRKGKHGLTWLDELKYLDRNPFVDEVKDFATPFTKGREHKLTIRLVQSNYRIKKNGEIFTINIENDYTRCKAYEFLYSYYKPINEKKDTEVKLYYGGFNLNMTYSKDNKTYIEYENN